ncbi:cytochrome c [Alteromonas sp. C1M14]|uniref:c-type cytochrome n=1 Tax=Alteromonas sp. C1M14 TaxID=2841567 RepID=UPI001C09DC47|nr:cytochrome c [Alteromonas sp. C1M14]MBU2979611.1 cytochrome c [Alteromonas sp. C1M14]
MPFFAALCLRVLGIALLLYLPSATSAGLTKAQTDYILQCQGCHKASGTGMPPQTPDFHEYGNDFMHMQEGRQYWISVPGAANSPLTDGELANVLNYIATDIVEVKNHTPFTANEVRAHRGKKMTNVYEVRRQLATKLTVTSP